MFHVKTKNSVTYVLEFVKILEHIIYSCLCTPHINVNTSGHFKLNTLTLCLLACILFLFFLFLFLTNGEVLFIIIILIKSQLGQFFLLWKTELITTSHHQQTVLTVDNLGHPSGLCASHFPAAGITEGILRVCFD